MKGKSLGLLAVVLIGGGVVAGSIAVQYSTQFQQHASQFNDLNSAEEITTTNNPDGTMGPATWVGNFSNTLPTAYLGTLNFEVTDPVQGRRPTDIPVTVTIPTRSLPTQAEGKPSTTPGQERNTDQGPQAVTSLVLTVTKVEVHLAQLGIPGMPNETTHGRPSGTPTPQGNQHVNKWETLNIGGTKTIDLVQLAKTNALSSLGITRLAKGRYTEVRLYVGSATAVLSDGTKVTLTIPGKANIVRVVEPFVIDSGKTTSVVMAFDAQNSVLKVGNLYILKPVVAHFNQQNQ